jgi:hypothetical protein
VLTLTQSKKPHQQVPLPAADDPEQQQGSDDFEVSDEDVEFVQQYGQQLGFLKQLNPQELERCVGCLLQWSAWLSKQPRSGAWLI